MKIYHKITFFIGILFFFTSIYILYYSLTIPHNSHLPPRLDERIMGIELFLVVFPLALIFSFLGFSSKKFSDDIVFLFILGSFLCFFGWAISVNPFIGGQMDLFLWYNPIFYIGIICLIIGMWIFFRSEG